MAANPVSRSLASAKMVKFDSRNIKVIGFDASWYRDRLQFLKLIAPLLVMLFEGVGKFIIPVETSGAGLLLYLFAKKHERGD